MELVEKFEGCDSTKFLLKSTDPTKPNMSYVCQGANEDERNQWVQYIRHILEEQKKFLKALQSPIAYQYSKDKTKNV